MRCACGVKEGELHRFGCQFDLCPVCFDSASTCKCKNTLTINKKYVITSSGKKSKRLFYIDLPTLCQMCGKNSPRFFMCADYDWKKIVPANLRDEVLCFKCFKKICELRGASISKHKWLVWPKKKNFCMFVPGREEKA